jgi:hypothetical protein
MPPRPLWSRAGLAAGIAVVALSTSGGGASASTVTAATSAPLASAVTIPRTTSGLPAGTKEACAAPTGLYQEQCASFVHGRGTAARAAASAPSTIPYAPSDLQSAYNLAAASAADGTGVRVAIVDAYADPNLASDLAAYREYYGLPACTAASGCLKILNESGGTSLAGIPADSTDGWEFEQSLDVDMVSAICPNCSITVYEAKSTSLADLGTAENSAASASKFVSNSWYGADSPGESYYDTAYFNHPGVVTAFASGDNGYMATYPASSQLVTSVGGTYLSKDSSTARGWTETVWNDSLGATASGCSSGEPKPSWQSDSGCANRTENDVAAIADGPEGVSVYDSYGSAAVCGGWCWGGGTSAATPIVTATYALAGTPAANTYPSEYLYQNASSGGFNRVTSGTDGTCESDRLYLCDASHSLSDGYNGPTGWGTPDGVSAFKSTSADTVSVINPGTYDLQAGVSYSFPAIKAYDSAGKTLTYLETGLPSGLTMNTSTGAISGKTAAGTHPVKIAVSDGTASTTITFEIVSVNSLSASYHAATGAVRLDLGGKCMDDAANSSANGNKIQIWTCNGWANQNWTYYPDSYPGGAGVLKHNGKCLDVIHGGRTNGTLLDLYTCNGTGSQQWYLTGSAGELVNPQSGKCAEDPYGSTVNGRQLDIWTCNGQNNQAWTVPASPVQSGVTGKCLDDKGASNANGNPIISYSCDGQSSQKWTLGLDETLRINGKCLDAAGYGTTNGTLTQLWNCTGATNQVWLITGTGEIENLNAEKCLADPGNSTANGTRLTLEDCTGAAGEIWAQS